MEYIVKIRRAGRSLSAERMERGVWGDYGMKKNGAIFTEDSIMLDKSRMDELCEILSKYCTGLEFQAHTLDNSSITFESYAELIRYKNFKKGRIARLTAFGYQDNNIKIVGMFSTERGKNGSIFDYTFRRPDEEAVFCRDVRDFLERAKTGGVLEKYGDALLALLVFVITSLLLRGLFSLPRFWLWVLSGIITLLAYWVLSGWIWKKLFPAVYFSWGEAEAYYKRLIQWRENVFWSVLVAFMVGLAASLLSGILL